MRRFLTVIGTAFVTLLALGVLFVLVYSLGFIRWDRHDGLDADVSNVSSELSVR
ncbi:MAG TPA: hypothetical protein VGG91_08020 [Myxococcaceae bacterium]